MPTKTKLLLLLLPLFTGCAHQDEWSRQDTVGQTITTIVILGDGWSSRNIQNEPYYWESGLVAQKVNGYNPSNEQLAAYHVSLSILSYFVARALPAEWRLGWQLIEITVHGLAIHNNCQMGLC